MKTRVRPKVEIRRQFKYRGKTIKVADVTFEDGDGTVHVWVNTVRITVFGYGSIREGVYAGKEYAKNWRKRS